MLTTKKLKAKFKVRIFDLKNGKDTSFSVYGDENNITLDQFKKKLQKKSNSG